MKSTTIVAGIVVIGAAVAIGFLALAPKSPCNQGVCKVTVTVQACQANGATATPDPVPVPAVSAAITRSYHCSATPPNRSASRR